MKKGFTLVELLATIVIIGLFTTVAYPLTIGIISESKNSAYNSQKKILEKAAKEWGVENSQKLPLIEELNGKCIGETVKISVSNLADGGFLTSSEIVNPKGGYFDGCIYINCDCDGNFCKYDYIYKDFCD